LRGFRFIQFFPSKPLQRAYRLIRKSKRVPRVYEAKSNPWTDINQYVDISAPLPSGIRNQWFLLRYQRAIGCVTVKHNILPWSWQVFREFWKLQTLIISWIWSTQGVPYHWASCLRSMIFRRDAACFKDESNSELISLLGMLAAIFEMRTSGPESHSRVQYHSVSYEMLDRVFDNDFGCMFSFKTI